MTEKDGLVAAATTLARRWHDGQADKAGLPYAGHLQRVAEAVSGWGPEAVAMAWLHDTLEDTGASVRGLRAAGIPERVVAGIQALTHGPGEPREAYYARILACGDPIVLAVKLADLRDNADPARLALVPQPDRARLEAKYARGLEALGSSLPGEAC